MMKILLILSLFSQTKNPVKAAWMSAVIPGMGQFYTKNYLKGAIFLGSEIYLMNELIKDYPYINKDENAMYRFSYNFILYIGIWAFNIADAYVSAHLYNFEKDTLLTSFHIIPNKSYGIIFIKRF